MSGQEREPTRREMVELDIDMRIADLWKELGFEKDLSDEERECIAVYMRAAYGKGYKDALEEDDREERGKLFLDNGYDVHGKKLN